VLTRDRYSAVLVVEEFWLSLCGDFLKGTPWIVWIQRALGAQIGENCLLFGYLLHADLCKVGDDCILEEGSVVQNHSWSRGQIVLDEIVVGNRCYMGKVSFVMRGAKLNDDAAVDHVTLILRNDELPPKTLWVGNPAKMANGRRCPHT